MEQSALLQRVGHVSLEPNPALLENAQKRAESVQNRIADPDHDVGFANSISLQIRPIEVADRVLEPTGSPVPAPPSPPRRNSRPLFRRNFRGKESPFMPRR
jgi:hypothetical protein